MKVIRKMFKFFLIMIFLAILAIGGLFLYAKIIPALEIRSVNSISLYDKDEMVFFQGNGGREWTDLSNISKYVIDATIVTEDKYFYNHFGFDFLRIVKASYVNITSRSMKQGASTITQQYAKNLFLDFDKTWKRKLNEMWLTIQIEMHYSKDDILEGYLNSINYGHGMYGIENASFYYFGKKSSELTLAESAMLVGIPKSPSNYSPIVNPNIAKNRQKMILSNMLKNKIINESDYNNALQEELTYIAKKDLINLSTVMYYQDAVISELKGITSIPNSYLETGGLKIFTNLDIKAQTILEESVTNEVGNINDLQVASVMIEPSSGKVIALLGGKNYNESQFNRATVSKRQVGSTMKPILYYAALENGFTSSTAFISEETTFNLSMDKTYSPKNYAEIYGNKAISMAAAIAFSDNIYAIKTHIFLGEEILVDMAKRVGIKTSLEPLVSLPLGTIELNIMELAGAYAVLANEGYRVNPYLISRVEDIDGSVLYEKKVEEELILNKSLVYILNNLLTGTYDASYIDYTYPTAMGLAPKMSRKYAIKTGSTDFDSVIFGYNREVVTAVWVGKDDNSMLDKEDFLHSRNIWINTMEKYLNGVDSVWYDMPSNVVGMVVDPITGKPANGETNKKKILYFIKGTEPKQTDLVFDEISGQ